MKEMIKKIVLRLFPEIAAGIHLPQLAVVTAIPDPPKNGEEYDEFRPYYAVDVRLLKPDLSIDGDMPLMRDVPVALPAAAPDRGFAALPQPGTVVELAFAFGRQTMPFVRSVLPYNLKLPAINAETQRWQQSADCFQEVNRLKHWIRETVSDVLDVGDNVKTEATDAGIKSGRTVLDSLEDLIAEAPKIWVGSRGGTAFGVIKFSRVNPLEILTIPSGTIVKSANGRLRLKTIAAGVFVPGSTEVDIAVEAEYPGSDYNLSPGEYCCLGSDISGVSVYNEDDWLKVPGVNGDNTLKIDSDFMAAVIAALNILSTHTHPEVGSCSQKVDIMAKSNLIVGLKGKLDPIIKT